MWLRRSPPDSAWTVVCLTLGLWLASAVLCYALLATPIMEGRQGLMNITESAGALERVALWQRALDWLPGGYADGTFVSWPKPLIAWTAMLAMVGMFLIHWLAFRSAWRSDRFPVWTWLIGPVGAHVILLLMAPSNADVFFYAISGDIANDGMNPYTTQVFEVAGNPLYPYNHWVELTTPYGPLWTMINQVILSIAGNGPVAVVVAYKVFFGLVALAVAISVWGAARMLGARPRFAAGAAVLIAWQPNMLIESSGQAHNDVVLIGLAFAAVMITILGSGNATRGGLILVTLSALIKFVSLPMLGILALTRLDSRRQSREHLRVLGAWVVDALAVGAVLVAVFRPYWSGWGTLRQMLIEPGRLYTNPLHIIPAGLIERFDVGAAQEYRDVSGVILQLIAILAILYIILRFGRTVWASPRAREGSPFPFPVWTRPLLVAYVAIFSVLAFVPANTHAWYWTWPIVPIALLLAWDAEHRQAEPEDHRWLHPYFILTTALTIIYHTRIVTP